MGVNFHRDPDIAVPHQILQRLQAEALLRHQRAERMPADMRRDMRQAMMSAYTNSDPAYCGATVCSETL